jgi:methyl-accepting chemotaxis protein
MTIRAKLSTAIVVAVAGLAITVGVAAWAMNELGDRFDDVQRAGDARALALRLKFDVTDFNGWQTAYGYDDGKSRPIYIAAFARFEDDLATARGVLKSSDETRLLDRIEAAADDFDRVDAVAWAALQAGRTEQVRRIFLGPEILNFHRAASAAQQLAELEDANARLQDREFEDARDDALRVLVGAGIVSALLIVILLVTAMDLARQAERKLEPNDD